MAKSSAGIANSNEITRDLRVGLDVIESRPIQAAFAIGPNRIAENVVR